MREYNAKVRTVPFKRQLSVLLTFGLTVFALDTSFATAPDWLWQVPGHVEGVTRVAASPDGSLLASSSDDRTVRIWEVATGRLRYSFTGHNGHVDALAFSPNGRTVASSSYDRNIHFADVETGSTSQVASGHADRILSLDYSPDGNYIVTASLDGTARLLTHLGQFVFSTGQLGSGAYSAAFAPDGKTFAVGTWSGTIHIWNLSSQQVERTLSGHSGIVMDLDYSPDSTYLASVSGDDSLRVWNAKLGTPIWFWTSNSVLRAVRFSPNGAAVAAAGQDRVIRTWDAATSVFLRDYRGHTDSVNGLDYSPDGLHIASASSDRTIRFWNTTSGQQERQYSSHRTYVHRIAISPDGSLVGTATGGYKIGVWDALAGTLLHEINAHTQQVHGLAFSPDSRYLASGSMDSTVCIYDALSGALVKKITGTENQIMSVAFSNDNRLLATGAISGQIRVYDVSTWTLLQTFGTVDAYVTDLKFTADDQYLLVGRFYKENVQLWQVAGGMLKRTFSGSNGYVLSLDLSPDGKRVAAGTSDGKLLVWNFDNGQLLWTFGGYSDSVEGVAFTKDGATVIGASFDSTVRAWNVVTGHATALWNEQVEHNYDVSVSELGDRIAIGGDVSGIANNTLTAVISPATIIPITGKITSGNQDSLGEADNDALIVSEGLSSQSSAKLATIEFRAIINTFSPTAVRCDVRSKVLEAADTNQEVQLYDFPNARWELVSGGRTEPLSSYSTTTTFIFTDCQRFVGPNGLVRMRCTIIPSRPRIGKAQDWSYHIDLVRLTIGL